MRILFITSGYPSRARISLCSFVREEAIGLARQSASCIVINPISWWHGLRRSGFPYHETEFKSEGGDVVEVYRPSFISWPPFFDKIPILRRLKFHFFWISVLAVVKRERLHFDAVIGQFLYYGGGAAVNVGRKLGVPVFAEIGEGRLADCHKTFSLHYMRKHIKNIAHFICNGTHLKEILEKHFLVDSSKISVLPNGIDISLFKPGDKVRARQKFGIPNDKFVVCSIGNYLYDKGVCRVAEAINGIHGVIGVYAGSGPCPPVGNNVYISRRFKHAELPDLLAASDVFVLPTLVEGCCNAIQEAMACGKAIVGPNTKQTADLIDETCAITVDPLDINAIRAAVLKLRAEPELCSRISQEAFRKSVKFDMVKRTRKLLSIINIAQTGCTGAAL